MEILPEVEVWYGLPAVRRRLAQELKTRGMAQKAIAETLGIAESAVSQYLSGKRGASAFPASLDAAFQESAERIRSGGQAVVVQETMRLVTVLRDTRVICDVHHQHTKGLPRCCSKCFSD